MASLFVTRWGRVHVEGQGVDQGTDPDALASALEVLANPTRIALLHRLGKPAFMPDLVEEFEMTRQALKKHLDALEGVDLVHARQSRRGALPATEYTANPAGLFALKENVASLAVHVDPEVLPPAQTLTAATDGTGPSMRGAGLLLVHGDSPGTWFALDPKNGWVVGRDPRGDVALPYDPFASARHALLRRVGGQWTLTDLHSTNGTRLNFRPLPSGEAVPVSPGDLLTVGKSHLLLRERP